MCIRSGLASGSETAFSAFLTCFIKIFAEALFPVPVDYIHNELVPQTLLNPTFPPQDILDCEIAQHVDRLLIETEF